MRLLLVENEVRGRDELFASVWIPHNGFLAQLNEIPFHQRTKRLVIERGLPQKLRRADWSFQSRDGFQKFCLSRRAFLQLFKFFIVDLATEMDEQLFFPSDFRAPDDLRQQTVHYSFNWAAIIGADPS